MQCFIDDKHPNSWNKDKISDIDLECIKLTIKKFCKTKDDEFEKLQMLQILIDNIDKLFTTTQINKICDNVLETLVEKAPDLEEFEKETSKYNTFSNKAISDYYREKQEKLEAKSTATYHMFVYLLSAPKINCVRYMTSNNLIPSQRETGN